MFNSSWIEIRSSLLNKATLPKPKKEVKRIFKKRSKKKIDIALDFLFWCGYVGGVLMTGT